MKKNGIALAIILIILVLTLVACGENDLDTCEHNVVIDEAVPATCTEMGLTEGAHCSKCGEVLLAQTEVPALGHTAADAVKENEIAPTCTTTGSYDSVVYCFVCNNELSRETKSVDALDHDIVNHNAQAPTCTEVGWEAYEACSRCDYTTYVEIPATGHNHVPAVTAPTCTERGYTTYTCHCGDTYIADGVPATGHNFEDNEYCLICSAEYYTEGLQFSLGKDEYTVTGIITSASDVTIPSTYQGHPVTEIATNAFYECTSLTSIVIPDSVTTIGKNVFMYCSNLTSVTFGENSQLTTIGDCAFYNCRSLTSIVIPASVTSIGELAFSGSNVIDVYYNGDVAGWCGITFGDSSANPMYLADNLYIDGKLVEGELKIPDSVTTIPTNAFQGCAVTSVTFGNESQLTAIDSYAFEFCKSLTSVTIPDGVTSIGNNAFSGCDNLTNVTFGNDSQLLEIGSYAFAFCYSLTSISIPNKVTNIGVEAFRYCYSIKTIFNYSSLDIVAGETTHGYIAEYADRIYDMTGDATLSEDEDGFVLYTKGNVCELVEYKGDATDVVIPDGITAINSRTFYDNDAIGMVFIPDGVTSIGNSAFFGCDNLTSVYYNGDVAGWCGITLGDSSANPMYYADNLYIDGKLVEGELVIPDSVTSIPAYAFRGQAITSVTIPDSVITIGGFAFYDCDSLTNVTFGANSQLTSIGERAFAYCTSLTSITIPDSVTTIGDSAFSVCTSLTSVTIGDSVTTIGGSAFY
ncbi:MAG: leucine-rich repeat domain-containing protein, partial [Clostridia bacterium]|nr:leucine-rich repeat domain-containing protein [Clostridia bacterium]